MTTMEQQVAALQNELVQSQQHVLRLGTALDELRNDSTAAVQNLKNMIDQQQRSDHRESRSDGKGHRIIRTKHFEPKNFAGKDEENY